MKVAPLEKSIQAAQASIKENAERIDAVDRRAQQGITAAAAADTKATAAQTAANAAQTAAQGADRKADTARILPPGGIPWASNSTVAQKVSEGWVWPDSLPYFEQARGHRLFVSLDFMGVCAKSLFQKMPLKTRACSD